MVMQLKPPAVVTAQYLDQIVAERQKGPNAKLFTGLLPEWKARAQDYQNQQGAPTLTTWPLAITNSVAFVGLYERPRPNSVQAPILKTLRAHDLRICPGCGELGEPNTLDHYLPKKKYPQFAILPLNLAPMCDACQKEKGAKTTVAPGARLFIHPYFSTFSQPQILELDIGPPFAAPSAILRPSAALTKDERDLVETHLRELDMHSRYARFFKSAYRKLLRNINRIRQTGQDVDASLDLFRFDEEAPSPNGWPHVFYTGVIANAPLVQFLKTAALGDFL